jgi:dihydrolipoamide dehydrogenase
MDQSNHFDVIVLGAGPGGYPAAIRASQRKLKTALIEAKEVGGTCLNRGCIPTKTLIAEAELLNQIKGAEEFGISVGPVSFSYAKMVERKERVVSKVRKGLEGLIGANQITLKQGFGRLISPTEIEVTGPQGKEVLTAKNIIIATGSEPKEMKAFPFDGVKVHNSTTILELKTLPTKIVIVGGGVIGCEFASLFRTLGVEVVILEMMPSILPMECKSVSSFLTKSFSRRGILVQTDAIVEGIDRFDAGVQVKLGSGEIITADLALISVGRSLNTSKIGLQEVGVKMKDNGLIEVNSKMQTTVANIYAVGDIASKWWLAHVASHQGLIAADNIGGHPAEMRYEAVPNVIFTDPEIATVGRTLEEAIEAGFDATIGVFPFQALGKAQAAMQTEGFAQIVQDKRSGQILGAQVIGHDASNLIGEMAVAVANELTIESISETIHAHPTIAEAWMEAALIAAETPLHMPPKKTVPKTA